MAIKATLQKKVYLLYDTTTELSISVELTEDTILILNEKGKKEFIFKTSNTTEVKEKWRNILKLLLDATKLPF